MCKCSCVSVFSSYPKNQLSNAGPVTHHNKVLAKVINLSQVDFPHLHMKVLMKTA